MGHQQELATSGKGLLYGIGPLILRQLSVQDNGGSGWGTYRRPLLILDRRSGSGEQECGQEQAEDGRTGHGRFQLKAASSIHLRQAIGVPYLGRASLTLSGRLHEDRSEYLLYPGAFTLRTLHFLLAVVRDLLHALEGVPAFPADIIVIRHPATPS